MIKKLRKTNTSNWSPALRLCRFASQLQTPLRPITNLALRNISDFTFAISISFNDSQERFKHYFWLQTL